MATTSQLRGEENFATLEEYRNQMFRQNPGEQLIVIHSRSNFIEELQGTYKNPEFNFKKKTHVVFSGEQGKFVANCLTGHPWLFKLDAHGYVK